MEAQQAEEYWKRAEEHRKQLADKLENLIVTATPTIQNQIIEQYLGVVSSVVVMGTGFLSEFEASLSDFLGVRASGFQDKLSRARDIAVNEIQGQAVQRGGDAIVGLDLDYMTLVANMFMVSANDTVVKLTQPEKGEVEIG